MGSVAAIAAMILSIGVVPTSAQAANAPTPPFSQCPAIGNSPSCEILLVVNADNSVSVIGDPAVGTFDGSDDTLVGIVNNSTSAVNAVTVSGPGTGLSGFDGDGICSGDYGPWNGSTACPYGPTGYEGPGTSFVTDPTQPDVAEVDFAGGLKPGGTAYFSLEGALTSAELTSREGGLCDAHQNYGTESVQHATSENTGQDVFNYKTFVAWCLRGDQVVLKPVVQDAQSASLVEKGFIEDYLEDKIGLSFIPNIADETIACNGTTCEFSGVKFVSRFDAGKPIELVAEFLLGRYVPIIRAASKLGGPTVTRVLDAFWAKAQAELPAFMARLLAHVPDSIRAWVREWIDDQLKELGADLLKKDASTLTAFVLAHLSSKNLTVEEITEWVDRAIKKIEDSLVIKKTVWAPDVTMTINGVNTPADVVVTGPIGAGLKVTKDKLIPSGPF